MLKMEPRIFRECVTLGHVADSTASYDVLPSVFTTFAPRVNVVDALGPATAILAKVVVANQHSFTM